MRARSLPRRRDTVWGPQIRAAARRRRSPSRAPSSPPGPRCGRGHAGPRDVERRGDARRRLRRESSSGTSPSRRARRASPARRRHSAPRDRSSGAGWRAPPGCRRGPSRDAASKPGAPRSRALRRRPRASWVTVSVGSHRPHPCRRGARRAGAEKLVPCEPAWIARRGPPSGTAPIIATPGATRSTSGAELENGETVVVLRWSRRP